MDFPNHIRLLSLCCLLSLTGSASAVQNNWTGGGNGSWANPTNWSLGVVPNASHDVTILSANVDVVLTNAAVVNSVTLARTMTITAGGTLHLGALTMQGGTYMDNYGVIAAATNGGTAIFSISGTFNNYGTLRAETNATLEVRAQNNSCFWRNGTVLAGPGMIRVTGFGTVNVDRTTTVSTTLENQGHLEGGNGSPSDPYGGKLTGPGLLKWTDGQLGGYPLPLTLDTNFHVEVSASAVKLMVNHGVINNGEMRGLGGGYLYGFIDFQNYGQFILETNCTMDGMQNYGTVSAAAGKGTVTLSLSSGIDNHGTLKAETNSVLVIDAQASHSILNHGSVLAGPGTIRVTGPGTIYVDRTTTVNTTLEHLGHLEGGNGSVFDPYGGKLTGPGLLKWLGGYIGGYPLGLVFDTNFHVELSGPATKEMVDHGVVNNGELKWLGGSNFITTPDFENHGQFILETNCAMTAVQNYGTVMAAADRGTVTLSLSFGIDNKGTLRAGTNSVLEINAQDSHSVLEDGNILAGPGTIRITGPGTVYVGGTTIVNTTLEHLGRLEGGNGSGFGWVVGKLTGPGLLKWLGGYIGGYPLSLTFDTGFHVELSGPATKETVNHGIINNGEVRWRGGDGFYCNEFYNYGVFRMETNCMLTGSGSGLQNYGTLEMLAGTLVASNESSLVLTGETKFALSGPMPSQFGNISFLNTAYLGGNVSVTLTNGFIPSLGNSFTLFSYLTYTGSLSSVQLPSLPGDLRWLVDFGATAFTLTVVPDMTIISPTRLGDGSYRFGFAGAPASMAIVQAATNLTATIQWTNVTTIAPFDGSLTFTDAEAAGFPQRFYRVLLVP